MSLMTVVLQKHITVCCFFQKSCPVQDNINTQSKKLRTTTIIHISRETIIIYIYLKVTFVCNFFVLKGTETVLNPMKIPHSIKTCNNDVFILMHVGSLENQIKNSFIQNSFLRKIEKITERQRQMVLSFLVMSRALTMRLTTN